MRRTAIIGRERRAHGARRAAALVLILALTCLATGGGCLGHIMGWSDAEVEKLRLIVAELEAKNAALVEENLALRKRLSGKPGAVKEAARREDRTER